MVKLEELTYYLVANPFQEEQIAVTDKYALTHILETYEQIGLKKTLHVPTENSDPIRVSNSREKVLETENLLQQKYGELSGNDLGMGVFFLGMSFTFTYLFFKPLFDLGAYALPRYRVRSIYEVPVAEVPPEVVNSPNLLDSIGRLFARFAGMIIGTLPLFIGIYFGIKNVRKWRKTKRFVERIEHIKNLELELIPNKNLYAFQTNSDKLIHQLREHALTIMKAKQRKDKLTICLQIEGKLRRLYTLSKSYGCDEVSSFYQDLEDGLSELKTTLIKSRFWKNEKKLLQNYFSGGY